jgi:hypothetical protein
MEQAGKADSTEVSGQTVPGVKFTATVPVWITSTGTIEEVLRLIEQDRTEGAVNCLQFYAGEMSKGEYPSTRVGMADIAVTLDPKDQLTRNALETLNNELAAARASFMSKQAEIMERISKLQAIEYVSEAA